VPWSGRKKKQEQERLLVEVLDKIGELAAYSVEWQTYSHKVTDYMNYLLDRWRRCILASPLGILGGGILGYGVATVYGGNYGRGIAYEAASYAAFIPMAVILLRGSRRPTTKGTFWKDNLAMLRGSVLVLVANVLMLVVQSLTS